MKQIGGKAFVQGAAYKDEDKISTTAVLAWKAVLEKISRLQIQGAVGSNEELTSSSVPLLLLRSS